MTSQTIDFSAGTPIVVSLMVDWRDGSNPNEPAVQVHQLDEHTFIIRQSLATNYEGPFVFLLFGNSGALLIDTGATEDETIWPLRATIDGIVVDWLARHPNPSYALTVAHSHGHDDHTAGDTQFAGRPNTTVVPPSLDGVQRFFGFTNWPDDTVPFDLGGRVITVIAGPGHEEAATLFYDPWTGILFTGDTLYPGRLYVVDMPAYLDTLQRAIEFLATAPVTQLFGCHIEMSATPGRDHPLGSLSHSGEAPLAMLPSQIIRLRERALAIAATPGVHGYDDVIIYNGAAVVDDYLRGTTSAGQ